MFHRGAVRRSSIFRYHWQDCPGRSAHPFWDHPRRDKLHPDLVDHRIVWVEPGDPVSVFNHFLMHHVYKVIGKHPVHRDLVHALEKWRDSWFGHEAFAAHEGDFALLESTTCNSFDAPLTSGAIPNDQVIYATSFTDWEPFDSNLFPPSPSDQLPIRDRRRDRRFRGFGDRYRRSHLVSDK